MARAAAFGEVERSAERGEDGAAGEPGKAGEPGVVVEGRVEEVGFDSLNLRVRSHRLPYIPGRDRIRNIGRGSVTLQRQGGDGRQK